MKKTMIALFLLLPLTLFASAFLGVVPSKSVSINVEGEPGYGLEIRKTVDAGPAMIVGLQKGDVLFHFGGKRIADEEDLSFFLRKYQAGDKVEVRWLRGDEVFTGKVELSDRGGAETGVRGHIRKALPVQASAFLGVSVISLNDELLDYFSVDGGHGVLIESVVSGTPADKAGLRVGDVLTELEGHDIDSPGRLRRLVRDQEPTSEVEIILVRDHQEIRLSVVLVARKLSKAEASFDEIGNDLSCLALLGELGLAIGEELEPGVRSLGSTLDLMDRLFPRPKIGLIRW
jgi:predicted metalloprotease with PDZ domain